MKKMKYENLKLLLAFSISILFDIIGYYVALNLAVMRNVDDISYYQYGSFHDVPYVVSSTYLPMFICWAIPIIAIWIYYARRRQLNYVTSKNFRYGIHYVLLRPIILMVTMCMDYFLRIRPIENVEVMSLDIFSQAYFAFLWQCKFIYPVGLIISYLPIVVFLIIGFVIFIKNVHKYYKIGIKSET